MDESNVGEVNRAFGARYAEANQFTSAALL